MRALTALGLFQDFVLIRPEPETETRSGLLVLPVNDNYSIGKVLEVGIGRFVDGVGLVEPYAHVGDVAFYPKANGVDITIGGEKLVLIKDTNIVGYESREPVEDDEFNNR